jgi:hypothetical protein
LKLKNRCILIACVFAMPLAAAFGQAGIGAGSAPPPSLIPANLHPATDATLRRYFEVCHFAVRNREGLEKQFEQQQKTLPPWYPADLWTETVAAVMDIDVVEVSIPVYKRFYSEEGTQSAIKLFVTPAGQKMVNQFHDKTLEEVSAGDPIAEARRKALADLKAKEDAEIHEMLSSMTPKEEQQVAAFVHSEEWKRMNGLSDQVYKAFNVAYLARQKEVMHAVALKHQDELVKSLREYKAAHPGYDPSAPPAAK